MATEGVPQWLVKEHRKYLKSVGTRVVSFRSRIATTLAAFEAAERRKQQVRVSGWATWSVRMRADWHAQGYDYPTIDTQLIRDGWLRQLTLATRRAQAVTDYQQQQQGGGFY